METSRQMYTFSFKSFDTDSGDALTLHEFLECIDAFGDRKASELGST